MLNTLTYLLEKRGEKYVDELLNSDLIITEKLDTYRVLFEKHGDHLVFFKKDNTELNLIERTLTNVWEDAIIELSTIIGDIMLPEGLRFGVAYTPVERPIRIPYSKIPKYVLTDITLRKNNKVVEVYEYDEVNQWATTLGLGRPPIIFAGILNEEQKNVLKNYAEGNLEKWHENFAKTITRLFGETYSKENIIEGIIIKRDKDLAQIVSYEFDILNEAYEKEESSRDFYDLILLNLNRFMDNYQIPVLEGKTSDEMYLELTSDIFNKFCDQFPNIVESVKPDYLTPPAYGYYGGLNLLLIKNKKTIDILEKGGKIYEALFRIIISSLRKPKKEFGLLSESAVNKFNTFVNVIKHVINEEVETQPQVGLLVENTINEVRSDNVVIGAMTHRQLSDIDNMRVIASVQKAFEPAMLDVVKGKEKVVVYITECRPFTTSQVENIRSMHRNWKCPVVIGSVSNERRMKGNKFLFTDDLIKAQLDAVAIENKDVVIAYFLMQSWSLTELFQYLRPKFEPIALITDTGKKSQFAIQLYFEDEVMGGRIGVEKDFNIGEMDNKDQLPAFRAIEDKLIVKFKEVTPPSIWGLFDSMSSEYRTWSGQFISVDFKENKFV